MRLAQVIRFIKRSNVRIACRQIAIATGSWARGEIVGYKMTWPLLTMISSRPSRIDIGADCTEANEEAAEKIQAHDVADVQKRGGASLR